MRVIDLRNTDLRVTRKKNSVYCVENSFGYVKIGRSRNLQKRYRTICEAGGIKLNKTFSVESCGSLEKIAHKHFESKRYVGEWFDADFEEVVTFLKENTREEVFETYTLSEEQEALENLRIDLGMGAIEFFQLKTWFRCVVETKQLNKIAEKIRKDLAELTSEELKEVDLDFVFDDYMRLEQKLNKKELEFLKAMMEHNGIVLQKTL